MGDLMTRPSGSAAASGAVGDAATGAATGAGMGTPAVGGATYTGAMAAADATAPADLTMRTLPSSSVISNSEMLDSDTKSIRVLSLRRSMDLLVYKKLRAVRQDGAKVGNTKNRGGRPYVLTPLTPFGWGAAAGQRSKQPDNLRHPSRK